MRVTAKGCVLIGEAGSCPPLPYLELSDDDGNALISADHALEYEGQDAPAAKGKSKPKAETPPPPPPPPPVEEPAGDTDPNAGKETDGEENRGETILHALDLVEPEGLEPEGDRQGKPTVAAIEAITGLADVTVEEIDAALAAHASA